MNKKLLISIAILIITLVALGFYTSSKSTEDIASQQNKETPVVTPQQNEIQKELDAADAQSFEEDFKIIDKEVNEL